MSPSQEDNLLNKTVKTMMSQVCKFALTYCCEVLIEGTIGVTVDKQKRIIIHFDDKILSANSTEACSASHNEPPPVSLPNLSTPQDPSLTDNTRQLNSEVPASLNSYLTGSLSSNWSGGGVPGGGSGTSSSMGAGLLKASGWETVPSTKMMSCFQVSSASHAALSQTLNETIAIDSDSDSLDGIPLQSMSSRTRHCYSSTVPRVVTRSSRKAFRRSRNMKEIITIKDKDLFESRGDLDEEMPEDLKSPSQLSVTPQRALASADCESIPDASESRSLFNDISPQGLGSPEDFDVKSGFELTTTGKPMSVCEICGRRVPTLCQLEAHLVSKHGVVESSQLGKITHFSCPVCSKNYRFQAQLDKHMVRHEVERPYKCRECRNAYRYEESLDLHVQVHSNRLHCSLCNKTYTNKVLFQKHIAYMHEKAKDVKNQ